MVQGKLKVKAKLPANVKNKRNNNKGPAATKRSNRPIAPKKTKFEEVHKLKKMISKNVNHAVEQEMRQRAGDNKKTYSKVEQAVAAYNTSKQTASTSTSTSTSK